MKKMSSTKDSLTSRMTIPDSKYNKILLSNIKHDLTNPINAILGYAELMIEYLEIGIDDRFISDMKNIHKSGSLLFKNINTYFSNTDGGNNELINELINIPKLQFAIRTPISTIIGLTEILREDAINNTSSRRKDINESLENIYTAAKLLIIQINELKKYSNRTVEEFLKHYKSDLYLNESSLKLYEKVDSIETSKGGNILIIEDDKSNLELLDKIISQTMHKTHCAESADKALDILSNHKINIDIILLDLIMPKMNGLELLQKIKSDNMLRNIPVIMLSGMDQLESTAECISNGADDFLFKPISKVLLNARIKNALEKKFFHDKEIEYQKQIKIEQ